MIRLYQLEWCPECHTVRQVMTELGLSYARRNTSSRGGSPRCSTSSEAGCGEDPMNAERA
jgi:hypothetical protein